MPKHKIKKNTTSKHPLTQIIKHKTPNNDEEASPNLPLSLFGQVLCYFLFSDVPGGPLPLATPITTLIRGTIWVLPAPSPPQSTVAEVTVSPASLLRGQITAFRIIIGPWRITGSSSPSLFPTLATYSILLNSSILLRLLCWAKREHKVTITFQNREGVYVQH